MDGQYQQSKDTPVIASAPRPLLVPSPQDQDLSLAERMRSAYPRLCDIEQNPGTVSELPKSETTITHGPPVIHQSHRDSQTGKLTMYQQSPRAAPSRLARWTINRNSEVARWPELSEFESNIRPDPVQVTNDDRLASKQLSVVSEREQSTDRENNKVLELPRLPLQFMASLPLSFPAWDMTAIDKQCVLIHYPVTKFVDTEESLLQLLDEIRYAIAEDVATFFF